MRLRTIARISVALSVILFCVAVGLYGLDRLAVANQERERSLYELVPQDCLGVMESDDVHFYMDVLPQMSYFGKLDQLHTLELFTFIFGGLDEYTTVRAHGLSSQMSRLLVSFHAPGTPRDQVVYFRTGLGEDQLLVEMLKERLHTDFQPKKVKYRGRTMMVYPLNDQDFLTTYTDGEVLAVSYEKRLIEQVIDAQLDDQSLEQDDTFLRAQRSKKSRHFLTFYGRGTAVPYLSCDSSYWSQYDVHFNSDVIYLSGDTFMPDSVEAMHRFFGQLPLVPNVKEDSVILSAQRDEVTAYITDAYNREEGAHQHELFNECVAGMSTDALFMLVTDMQKVVEEPDRFRELLPPYLMENAELMSAFVYSSQLSIVNGRLSHILMLTYKE